MLRALERLAIDLRYLAGVAGFLRHTVTLEQARANREQQIAARSENFLHLVERAVYASPRSPYARLLAHAGVEFGDLQRGVRVDGLEPTLEKLYDAGVYVTSEELKGRRPISRNGLEIPVKSADFDNPLGTSARVAQASSGSTGEATLSRASLENLASAAEDVLISSAAQIGDRPAAYWSPGGLRPFLFYSKSGRLPARVFLTNKPPPTFDGFRQRLNLQYTRLVSRAYGRPLPAPVYASRQEAVKIARWLASMTAAGTPAAMSCHSNPGVRICHAAKQHGLNISGTLFTVYGEPYTPGKAAALASVGATARVAYAMTETGIIARSCSHSTGLDDLHLYTHRVAVIQREHSTAPGESVGALIYTTVHPDNPKLLLNAQSGDYATLTQRDCVCLFGELGMNTHLSEIRSYEKLTSEGITFIGSRLYDLVEDVLPARFGGGINDYQLVEEEREDGLSQLLVVVSPRVGPVDEPEVVAAVLESLTDTHSHPGGAMMIEMFRQGRNLRVVRREPHSSGAKILPLHILRRSHETPAPEAAKR